MYFLNINLTIFNKNETAIVDNFDVTIENYILKFKGYIVRGYKILKETNIKCNSEATPLLWDVIRI